MPLTVTAILQMRKLMLLGNKTRVWEHDHNHMGNGDRTQTQGSVISFINT